MKEVQGVWLPDHEEHLLGYADKPGWTYQKHKLDAAVELCRKRDVVIDVGGHCGLWAMTLAKLFGHVHSFEPVPEHRACYEKNVKGNYTLHPYALGSEPGFASIRTTQGSSGDSWITKGSDVEVRTLDSFNLVPDLIKLDTEGHELFVLMGGEETLKHRPVIIVEQKPGHAKRFGLKDTEAVDWLRKRGYVLRGEISGDYILT